jgi:hypothetical protein
MPIISIQNIRSKPTFKENPILATKVICAKNLTKMRQFSEISLFDIPIDN